MEKEHKGLYHCTAVGDSKSSRDGGETEHNIDENKNTPDNNERSKWDLLRGHLFGVLMALLFTISAACSQSLGGLVPPFELNVCRFGSELLLAIAAIFYRRLPLLLAKTYMPYLTGYCFIGAVSNLLYYESAIYIPVGTLGGLESTCLIVLLTLITFILYRVFNVSILISVVLSVTGIVFLIQPVFIFGSTINIYTTPVCFHYTDNHVLCNNSTEITSGDFWNDSSNNASSNGSSQYKVVRNDYVKGYLLIVGASVSYATTATIQKHCLRDINGFSFIFWYSLSGTFLSAIVMFAVETPTFPVSARCILLLLGHSASGGAASCFGKLAVPLISPVTFSLLSSLQLIFFLVAQYTVQKNVNPGHRNWEEVFGGVLVVCGSASESVCMMYRQWKGDNVSDTDSETGPIITKASRQQLD